MAAPTHNLVLARRQEIPGKNKFTQVGVAWFDPAKNSLSLKLNEGVVLDWRMDDTHNLSLYPAKAAATGPAGMAPPPTRNDADPIPF